MTSPFPPICGVNHWALAGDWTMEQGAVVLNKPGGRIAYRFHARDLHLVMGPAAPGTARPLPRAASTDRRRAPHTAAMSTSRATARSPSSGSISSSGKQRPIADRLFEIEFLDPGVEAFAFTFG